MSDLKEKSVPAFKHRSLMLCRQTRQCTQIRVAPLVGTSAHSTLANIHGLCACFHRSLAPGQVDIVVLGEQTLLAVRETGPLMPQPHPPETSRPALFRDTLRAMRVAHRHLWLALYRTHSLGFASLSTETALRMLSSPLLFPTSRSHPAAEAIRRDAQLLRILRRDRRRCTSMLASCLHRI